MDGNLRAINVSSFNLPSLLEISAPLSFLSRKERFNISRGNWTVVERIATRKQESGERERERERKREREREARLESEILGEEHGGCSRVDS